MFVALNQAPVGVSLKIEGIADKSFALRIAHLGLVEGTLLTRLNDASSVGPAKIKGPNGERVLSDWLASYIVVHRDDGERLPLLECSPKDSGHVEGLTGHSDVEDSLMNLGIRENDRITFLRKIPPMTYVAVVNGKKKIQLSEGLASSILGQSDYGVVQFCSVGIEEPFVIQKILLDRVNTEALKSLLIKVGDNLSLQTVSVSQVVKFSDDKPIVCVTKEGLRLYIHEKDASDVMVSPIA